MESEFSQFFFFFKHTNVLVSGVKYSDLIFLYIAKYGSGVDPALLYLQFVFEAGNFLGPVSAALKIFNIN